MPEVVVGRWGRNLAIRVPMEITRAAGLSEGDTVEIIVLEDGDLVIRRCRARADAAAAAEEIISESRRHDLGNVSIRELVDEGRRG